jgi:glycosyltransferase involved in cell wall biosynthesis
MNQTDRQNSKSLWVQRDDTGRISSRIRIAYVIDNLRRDGTQTALVNLVRGLAERGYEQQVFSLNNTANADIVQLLADSGAQLVVIGKLQLVTLVGLVNLLVRFKRRRPLIVQTFLPFSDVVGRSLARIADVPIVISSIRARNVEKHWWQFLLDRMTIPWADRVVFNTSAAIPFALAKEGVRPEQVVYIPNGVTVARQNCSSNSPHIRHELGISPTARVVGMVGRLYPQKGHGHLLTAFTRVLEEVTDAILLIVGDGPLRNRLESQATHLGIAGQVHFLGERADVRALLAGIDVYVHASLYEGMPNAVMEAMAAGKPVVATAVDGTRELITHGQTGYLVPPSDPQAMADQIVYALKNVSQANLIGAAAAQRIIRDFSIDHMVSAYDKLYRELVR